MPNEIHYTEGTDLWFVPDSAAQAEDADFEAHNVSDGAGVWSEDLTIGDEGWHRIRVFVQLQATPTVGDLVRFYISRTTNGKSDQDDAADGAISAEDKLRNCLYLGAVEVDEAAANIEMSAEFEVYLACDSITLGMWNESGAATTNDVDENGAVVTPIPPEIQD